MLVGSVGGGALAQLGLGVPYVLRSVLLVVTFVLAWRSMHDIGFEPQRSAGIGREVRKIATASVEQGLRNRPVRLIMLSAPFSFGVGMWAFYAFQPHLLDLYGDPNAAWIAGTAAAVFAGARMVGGFLASFTTRGFANRSSVLAVAIVIQAAGLVVVGVTGEFWVALGALVVTSVSMAAAQPIRQTLLNGLIASEQRATVLSFDGLMASAGGHEAADHARPGEHSRRSSRDPRGVRITVEIEKMRLERVEGPQPNTEGERSREHDQPHGPVAQTLIDGGPRNATDFGTEPAGTHRFEPDVVHRHPGEYKRD